MSDAPEVKLILNDEQQHYVEMLKEGVSACPEGLSVSINSASALLPCSSERVCRANSEGLRAPSSSVFTLRSL